MPVIFVSIDVPDVFEVLIEKRVAQPVACVGEEGLDRPPGSRSPQPIDTISCGQIGFHHGDVCAETAKAFRSGLNLWSVGCDQTDRIPPPRKSLPIRVRCLKRPR